MDIVGGKWSLLMKILCNLKTKNEYLVGSYPHWLGVIMDRYGHGVAPCLLIYKVSMSVMSTWILLLING